MNDVVDGQFFIVTALDGASLAEFEFDLGDGTVGNNRVAIGIDLTDPNLTLELVSNQIVDAINGAGLTTQVGNVDFPTTVEHTMGTILPVEHHEDTPS